MKNVNLAVLFISTVCCTHHSEESTHFETDQLLNDIGNFLILPAVEDFSEQSKILDDVVEKFHETPSEALLTAAKNQWEVTAKSFEPVYLFNIGEVKRARYHLKHYNWPTNPDKVESNAALEALSQSTLNELSSSTKGLGSIEYLLFNEAAENLMHRDAVSEKRRTYLKLICAELENNAAELNEKWQPDIHDYLGKFITSKGSSTLEDPFNMLYNGMFNMVDHAKVTKIGKPAGLETSKTTNSKLVQAPYSGYSAAILLKDLEAIETLFFYTDGKNIGDYLLFKTKENTMAEQLKKLLENCRTALQKLQNPLHIAIDLEKETVAEIHENFRALEQFTRIEIRSALSVIITSTDNDGD